MINDSQIFTLRFFGNGVNPESFTIKELALLLSDFEDAINSLIDGTSDSCQISLIEIKNESNSLCLKPKNEISNIAINKYGDLVATNLYTNLPEDAYKFHKKLVHIGKDKSCDISFSSESKELFSVKVEDEFITQEKVSIRTRTTLYGHLIGLSKPNSESSKAKARIELFTGEKISFEVSDLDRERLIPYLWNHSVGVTGLATYNILTKSYIKFKFLSVSEYRTGKVIEGLNKLKQLSSGFWDTLNTDEAISKYLKD